MASATAASAQGGATIKGTITAVGGGPLEGAQVAMQALLVGGVTDAKGTYSFQISAANVKGQTVTLTARRIGFSPVSKQVVLSPGEHTVDFTLPEDVRRLNEVVVTGLAGATEMKNTTISISKVNEAQLQSVPAPDVATALTGKVSGVTVLSENGAPGSPATVQIRGATLLQVGRSEPVYVIDGVISKNGLSSIDPQDIISIEVLKGGASAAAYGSQGANGVIAVTTRRGKSIPDGQVQFTVQSSFGKSSIEHYPSLNHANNYELNPDGTFVTDASGGRQIKADQIMDNPYPTPAQDPVHFWRNQLKTWLQSRPITNNYLHMGYRRGVTNFMASVSMDRNPGILPLIDGFGRENFRFNIDQGITDKLDASASFMYGTTKSDQAAGTGDFFSLLQAPPDLDLAHPNGPSDTVLYNNQLDPNIAVNARGNPLYDLANHKTKDNVERLFGSGTVRYRPTAWLTLDGSYGTDRYDDLSSNYQFDGILSTDGVPQPGSLNYHTARDIANNANLNATFNYALQSLRMTTKLTHLYDEEQQTIVNVNGGQFAIRATPTLDAIDPATFRANSAVIPTRAREYLAQQSFNYDDRYLLDASYMRDGSSLFGSQARWNNFYSVSGAWRVTQDFHIPGFQELKLRAAHGTAGLRPGFGDKDLALNVANGNYDKNTLGNEFLEPAIQHETEFGIDASFLNRFDLEVVKSKRSTSNAFLEVPQSPALADGYQFQWQNAATIADRSLELSLTTRVIEHPNFSYEFTLTGQHTRQHIDSLGAPPFQVNAGGQGQGIFYYKQGEDLGVIYGVKWVTDYSQLLDNPANAGMTLADAQAQYTKNALGYVVLKSTKGTPDEAPIKYVTKDGASQVVIGNTNPDFTWGWANTVRFKHFTVYALFNGTQGGQVYNFSKQWMFQDGRSGDLDQSKRKPEDRIAAGFYQNGLYNVLTPDSYFVEDGTFVKLRELSVNYQFSNSTLHSLGLDHWVRSLKLALIGRNLKTWTNYSGFDPEAGSGGDAAFRIDGFRYPTFRTISGQIEIGF
ncbi:MAG TPA: SusC/RagA family TonB-linked outer membrane protein [Gemmatimonadaceae bacterium]